jgi:hypothetical protein
VAAHDVADGVAARLAGGQADAGQLPHDRGDVGQLDEVHLHVLAGGDVAPAPRVGLDQVGQHLQLLGLERPVRDLHPHHLVGAALALAVDAVVEAEDAEGVLVHGAGLVLGQHPLELLNVCESGGADGARPDLDVDCRAHFGVWLMFGLLWARILKPDRFTHDSVVR